MASGGVDGIGTKGRMQIREGHVEIVLRPKPASEPLPKTVDFLVDLRADRLTDAQQYAENAAAVGELMAADRYIGPDPIVRVRNLQVIGSVGFISGAPLDLAIDGTEHPHFHALHCAIFQRNGTIPNRDSRTEVSEPGVYFFEKHKKKKIGKYYQYFPIQ